MTTFPKFWPVAPFYPKMTQFWTIFTQNDLFWPNWRLGGGDRVSFSIGYWNYWPNFKSIGALKLDLYGLLYFILHTYYSYFHTYFVLSIFGNPEKKMLNGKKSSLSVYSQKIKFLFYWSESLQTSSDLLDTPSYQMWAHSELLKYSILGVFSGILHNKDNTRQTFKNGVRLCT